jgi:very-short-patch-repair endonuclease
MRRDAETKARVRALRENSTPAEAKLWAILRAHRFDGVKFTRQVPIGPFFADFAARARKLIIEIDGDTHGRQLDYDARRTEFLERQGYRVIRFTNAEIMGNIEGVHYAVGEALRAAPLS